MSALIFDAVGVPRDVLRYDADWHPDAAAGDVIVDVRARPIHPADHYFINGRYRIQPSLPQPAGLEGMGVIADALAGTGFSAGDRVAFRSPGSWASEAIVPIDRLIAVPDGVSDEAACQVSLNPVTAFGLMEQAGVDRSDWIVLTAATSAVANVVAAIARARGVGTIGVVRPGSGSDDARCATDHVLPLGEDLPERIRKATGGDLVAAVIDSVGGPGLLPLFDSLRPGGRIVAYGVMDGRPTPITNAMLVYGNVVWSGFGIDRWLAGRGREQREAMMEEIWKMIVSGRLVLPVEKTFGLPQFHDAFDADAAPGRRGKIVFVS